MQAIILAAGMGRRLGVLTKNNTKCMIRVNGIPLIKRMLNQLDTLSLNRILIVIGYEGKSLQNYIYTLNINTPIVYIENPVYYKTNNIYSLALTKKQMQEDDTLLLESDLIFESNILYRLIEDKRPNLALISKYESWMDGTMVKIDKDNNILNFVHKKSFDFSEVRSYYKTVNIYKFSKEFTSSVYVPFLEAYMKTVGFNEYYEQVLKMIVSLDKSDLKALVLGDEKWYEIDDIQDLDIAETVFADENDKLALFQKRYGGYWRFPKLLDFCYLVNPFFPSQRMKDEIKANFDILLTEYPSGMGVNSLLTSKYFGINKNYVCVGNGAVELIKSLMKCTKGKIGIVYPTFEEYPNRTDESSIIKYTPNNNDFSYSANDLISFYKDKEISTLILINPDNPSGNLICKNGIIELINWTKNMSITIIVDESFIDFSDNLMHNSILKDDILEENKHLIVLKSISKSYGVPGLRLGILATANEEMISFIRDDIAIWNINSFAEYYMQIFNKYEYDYEKACKEFIYERELFYRDLQHIPYLRIIKSQANYFLCEVIGNYTATELTKLLLIRKNILIKDCSCKAGFDGSNYVRIAIRNREDNMLLYMSLKELIIREKDKVNEDNNA
jgi:histidinol-phosphate/aromatic aminotransferase/cobyric acid decarboxylase-like protein/choline kinase